MASLSCSSMEATKKLTKGKRKITIEPITNKARKQVTFSKRRVGLFKKAKELSSMCGADVAVFTFSAGGKLFSFGNPNADVIIQRYINSSQNPLLFGDVKQEDDSCDKNLANGESPRGGGGVEKSGFWWDRNVDGLELNELEEFKVQLEKLRDEVIARLGTT